MYGKIAILTVTLAIPALIVAVPLPANGKSTTYEACHDTDLCL